MNATTLESRQWSRQRWWTLIVLVLSTHVALIVALGDRKPLVVRPPAPAPMLRLGSDRDEVIGLNDPTLFALPHRQGFAGAAWLQVPETKFPPFRWMEPARLLALPAEKLGAAFAQFLQTNAPARFEIEIKPAAELIVPTAPEIGPSPVGRSTLRITGGLAGRRLLNPPELPSWPAAGLLTNSVVQVLVGAEGYVMSPPILLVRSGSGSPEADQQALRIARASRFEPQRQAGNKLTLGVIVFEWHTVPTTNAPVLAP